MGVGDDDGGGGFPPPGSTSCAQPPPERRFLLCLLRQVRSPGGPGPLTAVLMHPSPGPTSAAEPARRCHRSAEGPHPRVNFTPLAIVNNHLNRQTSGQSAAAPGGGAKPAILGPNGAEEQEKEGKRMWGEQDAALLADAGLCCCRSHAGGPFRSCMQLICMNALYTKAHFNVGGCKHEQPAAFNIPSADARTKWTFLISAGVHGGVFTETPAAHRDDASACLHPS